MSIEPHAFLATAIHRPLDLRDYELRVLGAATAPAAYPAVFMQENAWDAPIYYQAQQPACGAHAGAFLKALLDSYESKPRKYSPRFTWADIKTFDGHPIEDGTDMRSIFKSLANAGALDFDLLGNDVQLAPDEYAHPTITSAMRENANPHIIKTYGFESSITFESLKRAIYQHKGLIARVDIGNEWWTSINGTSSWAEKDILPLRPLSSIVGGHFIVLHSYDEQLIYFANSFSTGWGRKGHGYFGPDYMPFVTDAGSAVDVPDELLPKYISLISILQRLKAMLTK